MAVVMAGALAADTMPCGFTTSGTLAGAPPNIVFNAQNSSGSTYTCAEGLIVGLGSLTLSKPGAQTTIHYDDAFTLNVTFATPTASTIVSFDALLSGILKNGTGQSDVGLIFNPASKVVRFTGPSNGSFLFTVNDLVDMNHSSGNPGTYNLTGTISQARFDLAPDQQATPQAINLAVVPEPSSIFLLFTAAGGLWIRAKRRGKIRQA